MDRIEELCMKRYKLDVAKDKHHQWFWRRTMKYRMKARFHRLTVLQTLHHRRKQDMDGDFEQTAARNFDFFEGGSALGAKGYLGELPRGTTDWNVAQYKTPKHNATQRARGRTATTLSLEKLVILKPSLTDTLRKELSGSVTRPTSHLVFHRWLLEAKAQDLSMTLGTIGLGELGAKPPTGSRKSRDDRQASSGVSITPTSMTSSLTTPCSTLPSALVSL